MAYSVRHTQTSGARPHWYLLERWADGNKATRRASAYVLDHGGYVYVTDSAGKIIYGTDPAELDRSIASGLNRHFSA